MFVFLFLQDVLEIKVSHQGYADPNNVRFTQIKILGLSSTVRRVMVSQDGQEIPSPHVVSYNSEKQVYPFSFPPELMILVTNHGRAVQ